MSLVAVTKMHGTLNDFVILDLRTPATMDLRSFARNVCDRRGGVGADGVIVLQPSQVADARMRVINADGSEAEMCGNGARCAAEYLAERGEGTHLRFETLAGIVAADVVSPGQVRLNVGVPRFEARDLPFENADFVSMGNPHAVIFTQALDEVDIEALGRAHPEINIHLVQVIDRKRMRVRHHERGAGVTYSCGTGAVACASAAMRRGMVDSPVDVNVPGGHLLVEWDGEHEAFLTGPAVKVFDASVEREHALPLQ